MIDRHFDNRRASMSFSRKLLQWLHMEPLLLLGILLLISAGLIVLYSAGDQSMALTNRQVTRLGLAMFMMLVLANISTDSLRF